MLDFPTTPTGEVRSVRKPAHKEHPHPTSLWGGGVWCGGKELPKTGGDRFQNPDPSLPFQSGFRTGGGAA
ncbi:hypothetical protein GGQ85_000190 [Nitrobacter vulgaris]|nr:hypothetical protein [Nitrobacter vulgaris]